MSETAQYPTAITSQLYEAVARLSTTLTEDITADSTDIKVASTTGFPASGFIVIENETIFYDSKDADSFTVSTGRGYAGTAAAHTATTAVRYAIVAATINRVIAELTAVQQKVGISGSTYTTTVDYKLTHLPSQSVTTQVTNLNAQYFGGSTTGEFVNIATAQTLTGKKTMGAVVQTVTAYTPDAAATATLDVSVGNIHKITMPAGNITIAISNETVGQCFMIEITQDGTGSRTVTWFTTIRWADGSAPTLTTTANKRDVFGFRVTGADTYDGYVIGQNI